MKRRTWKWTTVAYLFAALAIPVRLAAQEHHRYKLIDLGTFGGPASYLANDATGAGSASGVLNEQGTVVGAADTSLPNLAYPNCCILGPFDPFIFHAFQWRDGVVTDLGTLPGGSNSFTNWISAKGLIAGFSENGAIDPLLGVPEAHATLWKHGEIIDLGTLEGGHETNAFAVNDKGQVVGDALNTIPDPFDPIFGTQIRAFLWQDGVMNDLGTLGGSEAQAFLVNERGQVAGFSFTNSTLNPGTGMPTQDPFLWEYGKMVDLGTLGGTVGVANALNNRGQVVGQSNLAGDLTAHPFLWDRGVLTDLGTLGGDFGIAHWITDAAKIVGFASTPGDQAVHGFLWKDGVMTDLGTVNNEPCSTAQGINSKDQIVGISFNCIAGGYAWLWENGGPIVDLNTLVLPGSNLALQVAENINNRGEITGLGAPPGCADAFACGHVFVLMPCDLDHADTEGCKDAGEATADVSPNSAGSIRQGPPAVNQNSPAVMEMIARTRARLIRRFQVPGLAPPPR